MMLIVAMGTVVLLGTAHGFLGFDGTKREVAANSSGSGAPGAVGFSHGGGSAPMGPAQGMAAVIQDAILRGYSKAKIGDAFGNYRYLKNKEWSETRGARGTFYVDFVGLSPVGWFDFAARRNGISSRGIEVKFVVHPDGAYEVGMVSKVVVKTDGKTYRYPQTDITGILDAVYANKAISY